MKVIIFIIVICHDFFSYNRDFIVSCAGWNVKSGKNRSVFINTDINFFTANSAFWCLWLHLQQTTVFDMGSATSWLSKTKNNCSMASDLLTGKPFYWAVLKIRDLTAGGKPDLVRIANLRRPSGAHNNVSSPLKWCIKESDNRSCRRPNAFNTTVKADGLVRGVR